MVLDTWKIFEKATLFTDGKFKKIKVDLLLAERKGHETGIFTQQKRKFLAFKCAETLNQLSQMCAGDAANNT